ncbi:MAG: amidohydrolase/deacetylase family metallohydrolase [Bryobacteraceae bacterium]
MKVFLFLAAACAFAQPYDLLLKGGRVIDPMNNLSGKLDVAIAGGKIAKVAPDIPGGDAKRVADVSGLYVTPGLIDIHVHVYAGTGLPGVLTGDNSVYPDGFSFRSGVTTVVDAGTAGWRNFPDFRNRVIGRSKTRVLALLNVVGGGMGPSGENEPHDMDVQAAASMAKRNSEVIVGVKTAHYGGPEWVSVENAVKIGQEANIPVMVDFGANRPERPLRDLLLDKLRPGDIYTHCFSGNRTELIDARLNPAMPMGQKRGVFFDVGHGGGSFRWNVAVQAVKEGFFPDSISTDLHTGSMNAGMKDMTNVMSKFLSLGVPLEQVIRMSTWTPANEIKRRELGHLTAGAGADVAVLRVDNGKYGFLDSSGARYDGTRMIVAEMTIRDGSVVWDLNGRAAQDWQQFYTNWQPRRR